MSSSPRQKPPRLLKAVKDILGPQGRLASAWPGYEHRVGQLQMALEVARAFENQDAALVEAGTGTGKTLAYLIPALLSGRKTVVSTGTKNLQEQIFFKDLPFLKKSLRADFRAAYLKGRENYLCLYLYKAFLREPFFSLADEALLFDLLKTWVGKTMTGDRAELIDFPDGFAAWSELSAPGDRCLGSKCPEFKDCFLHKARRVAAAADLVIVNHHLFMADLAVRGSGQGEVIPDYEAVIFDEAHQLEDVATQYFGLAVSSWRLAALRRDVERVLSRSRKMEPVLGRTLTALGHQSDALAKKFFTQIDEIELWSGRESEMEALRKFGAEVAAGLDGLGGLLETAAEGDEEISGLARRARQTSRDLGFILEGRDSNYVYWAERRGKGLFLHASPIVVSQFLQENLYRRGLTLVFTSATLTAERSFDYFKERLGLWPEIEGAILESPFDFQKQTLLYIPDNFPSPQSPDFLQALTAEVERLLSLSRGRAFVLFTSYRNLNHVAQALKDRLPWTCLVQGQAPRNALLERFRQETDSVLMATQSFWQGVDVPGESLSAVIIDKLPFPRPDAPLVKARTQRLRQEGHDPFLSYSIPEAIISLKQGLGRLIRTTTDHGLLAILDSRLVTRGYGRRFLQSLPDRPLTHDLEEVAGFFSR
ncbi:MAG: ATP-dependent DNA helicase [Pseudomonadota bacterium]